MKTIILASASERRKEILEKAGIKFKVVKSDFKEYVDPKLTPYELVKKLSLEKAKAVFQKHKNCIIIAADTFVLCNSKILGKPKDKKDAKQMLSWLSNKTHLVITGFTIIDGCLDRIITKSQVSKVWMKKLSAKEINNYIATKEPFGKAGAYAIQGLGSIFIKKIEGDFFNAVGLPAFALAQELKKLGVEML